MPFTPFHVGPHATVAFAFPRVIDVPIFILSNIVIDLEPLYVLVFRPDYPLHGYFHTFLFGSILGLVFGVVSFQLKNRLGELMAIFHLPYSTSLARMVVSAILGVWLHILFDAPMYSDIRPFYPSNVNPLLGLYSIPMGYLICLFLFLPAFMLYFLTARSYGKTSNQGVQRDAGSAGAPDA